MGTVGVCMVGMCVSAVVVRNTAWRTARACTRVPAQYVGLMCMCVFMYAKLCWLYFYG